MDFFCATVEDTRALGARLAARGAANTVIALQGELGAGKTAFAQGVGQGLGVVEGVTSPTFIVVAVHTSGRLPLVHADLYRVAHPRELDQLGLDDAMRGAVALIEWADLYPEVLPPDHLEVTLEHAEGGRRVHLRATGPHHLALIAGLT